MIAKLGVHGVGAQLAGESRLGLIPSPLTNDLETVGVVNINRTIDSCKGVTGTIRQFLTLVILNDRPPSCHTS